MGSNIIPSFRERIGDLVDKVSDTFAGAGMVPGKLFDDRPGKGKEEDDEFGPANLTKEEDRAWLVRDKITATQGMVKNFTNALKVVKKQEEASEKVIEFGKQLFSEAVSKMRGAWKWKDNNLYWTRLIFRCIVKKNKNDIVKNNADDLVKKLEEYSRGRATVDFGTDASVKKVLLSGFEPFQIPAGDELTAANPSGMAALALHGKVIGNVMIQSVVWSNRYEDFDSGLIEDFYEPYLAKADMIVTLSLDAGTRNCLDVERYAANYRGGWDDNNYKTVSAGRTIGSEKPYYETTLPVKKMVPPNKKSGFFKVSLREDYEVKFKNGSKGEETDKRNDDPSKPMTHLKIDEVEDMKNGSGGDYFSNEVFFRVARTRDRVKSDFPSGHVHIPSVPSGKNQKFVDLILKIIKDAF
jgi:pyrrolidone-carboxylate peptidase